MTTYVGVKLISAEPMSRGDYNKYRGWTIPEDENPADEGYHVKYSDGYESWSPKSAFEEAYSEVGSNPLKDTTILMCSKDYKERFLAEYYQLTTRFRGLMAMLDKWDKGELNFIPICPRSLYNLQLQAMSDYIAVLEARAAIEKIDL